MTIRRCFYSLCFVFLVLIPFGSSYAACPDSKNGQLVDGRERIYFSGRSIAEVRALSSTDALNDTMSYIVDRAALKARRFSEKRVNAIFSTDARVIGLGRALPDLAFVYIISGDVGYLPTIVDIMNAAADNTNWSGNNDIDAANLLFGASIVLDWLCEVLPPHRIPDYTRAIELHAEMLLNIIEQDSMWWVDSYLQNHNYTNHMALAVAAVVLDKVRPDKKYRDWLEVAQRNFNQVLSVLSPDGASHEGVGYWGAGMKSLLQYYLAINSMTSRTALPEHPYFRNASTYRLYMSLPGYEQNVDYGDSARYDWSGPGYILRALASVYRDGTAQWLADTIGESRAKHNKSKQWWKQSHYSWMDILWYDSSVPPEPPDARPTQHHFENMGIYVWREDWGSDATYVFVKAGPPQGKHALAMGKFPGSHIDPDQGHFMIYSRGRWIAIDEGYIDIKSSAYHNVILIDSRGQLGESTSLAGFRGAALKRGRVAPEIVSMIDLPEGGSRITMSLAGVYPKELGMDSWTRILTIKQGGAVSIDDNVNLSTRRWLESNIHVPGELIRISDNAFCIGTTGHAIFYDNDVNNQVVAVSNRSIPKKLTKIRGGKGAFVNEHRYTFSITAHEQNVRMATRIEPYRACITESKRRADRSVNQSGSPLG